MVKNCLKVSNYKYQLTRRISSQFNHLVIKPLTEPNISKFALSLSFFRESFQTGKMNSTWLFNKIVAQNAVTSPVNNLSVFSSGQKKRRPASRGSQPFSTISLLHNHFSIFQSILFYFTLKVKMLLFWIKVREAAKRVLFLVARPLLEGKGGGVRAWPLREKDFFEALNKSQKVENGWLPRVIVRLSFSILKNNGINY